MHAAPDQTPEAIRVVTKFLWGPKALPYTHNDGSVETQWRWLRKATWRQRRISGSLYDVTPSWEDVCWETPDGHDSPSAYNALADTAGWAILCGLD